MAVPKKRVSKAKKNSRKANWYRISKLKAQNALSLAKSLLTQRSTSFFIPAKPEEEEEE